MKIVLGSMIIMSLSIPSLLKAGVDERQDRTTAVLVAKMQSIGDVVEISGQNNTIATASLNGWQKRSVNGLTLQPGTWMIKASSDLALNPNVTLNYSLGFSSSAENPKDISGSNANLFFFANNGYNTHHSAIETVGLHVVKLTKPTTYYIWYGGYFGSGDIKYSNGILRAVRLN